MVEHDDELMIFHRYTELELCIAYIWLFNLNVYNIHTYGLCLCEYNLYNSEEYLLNTPIGHI